MKSRFELIVFDWDGTEQAGNVNREVRTPFTIEMSGFKPPFTISAKPKKAIIVATPSREQKLVRQGRRKPLTGTKSTASPA